MPQNLFFPVLLSILLTLAGCGRYGTIRMNPKKYAVDKDIDAAKLIEDASSDNHPFNLQYPQNGHLVFDVDMPIRAQLPTNGGGKITAYTISPALPEGIVLDPGTGSLSGTPTYRDSETNYTVVGTNSTGSVLAALSITVEDKAPLNLVYAQNPMEFQIGDYQSFYPSNDGGHASFSISPQLPDGLSIDSWDGRISGSADVLSPATSYTVTATNARGTASTTITLSVVEAPPRNLTYTHKNLVYYQNVLAPENVPTNYGGIITSYSISPSLPAGLSLNSVTGLISGKPTVISPVTNYKVVGSNALGSTSITLEIVVVAQPSLMYPESSYLVEKYREFPTITPIALAPVTSYSITPALNELTFNPATGAISGTPYSDLPPTAYTIKGVTANGTVSTTLVIGIGSAPFYLHYKFASGNYASWSSGMQEKDFFTKGVAIAPITPNTVLSGAVYSAESLPAGLVINPTTGVITGTPTQATPKATFWVKVTNAFGSTQNAISIVVNDPMSAPLQLTYLSEGQPRRFDPEGSQFAGDVGTPIARIMPLYYGARANRFSISHPLPKGVFLNQSTGIIEGTPLEPAPFSEYSITATNGYGSMTANLTFGVYKLHADRVFSKGGDYCSTDHGFATCGDSYFAEYSKTILPDAWLNRAIKQLFLVYSETWALIDGGIQMQDPDHPREFSFNQDLSQGVAAFDVGKHSDFYCALSNGLLHCWGEGNDGQLGDGERESHNRPSTVKGLTGITAFSTGQSHACAISNGQVWCWGENSHSELGVSYSEDETIPNLVQGLPGRATAILASQYHTCAIVDGAVWCWGRNSEGQLGQPASVEESLPIRVPGINGATALAGKYETCAIVNGGMVCWGGWQGYKTPTLVPGFTSGVSQIANNGCAIVAGQLKCLRPIPNPD